MVLVEQRAEDLEAGAALRAGAAPSAWPCRSAAPAPWRARWLSSITAAEATSGSIRLSNELSRPVWLAAWPATLRLTSLLPKI